MRPSFLDQTDEDADDINEVTDTSAATSSPPANQPKDDKGSSQVKPKIEKEKENKTSKEVQPKASATTKDKTDKSNEAKPPNDEEARLKKPAKKVASESVAQGDLFADSNDFDASFKEEEEPEKKVDTEDVKSQDDFDASFSDGATKPNLDLDSKAEKGGDAEFDSSFDDDDQDADLRNNYIDEESAEERYKGSDRANRFYSYKGDAREKVVECYECFKSHNIVKDSTSSMCPNCGAYIALKDYEISNFWTSTIRTRGDVVITKKGNVRNVTVFCDNMVVEGVLNATADCSGTLTFKNSGRVSGNVNCMKLVVEKGVAVFFERAVRAIEVEVKGKVTANLKDAEKVTIFKKGELQGELKTKSLEVFTGGQHTGAIEILPPLPQVNK